MHFREPFRLQKKTLLEKADLDKAIDFMDVIEEDIPKGERLALELSSDVLEIPNDTFMVLTQILIG